MEAFQADVTAIAEENDSFRTVLFTGKHSQLVVMSLRAGEDIGEEVHGVDQLLCIVSGEGEAVLDGRVSNLTKGQVVCVPAGAWHNVRNTGDRPMKLFTVYAPAEHAAGTVHPTKRDALEAESAEAAARDSRVAVSPSANT